MTALENDLDNMYESFRQRQREKDPSAALKAEKKKLKSENRSSYKEQFEEWYGVEYEKKSRAMQSAMEGGKGSDDDDDSSANGDGGEEEDVLMTDSESESEDAKLSSRAKTFFDNPVFKSMKDYDEIAKRAPPKKKKSQNGGTFDSEVVGFSSDEDEEDDDEAIKAMNAKADRKRKRSKEEQEEEEDDEEEEGSNKVQIVPAEMDGAEDSDDNGKPRQCGGGLSVCLKLFPPLPLIPPLSILKEDYVLKTAAAYSLAQKLIHPSGKRDLIDDGFSKFAFDDHELLPSWFVEDEQRHYKPNIPVTKEAVELMRTRAKEMNARPIKKVAEAKFRKRFKAMKKAEKLQQKANLIAEDDDMPEAAKAKSIVKLMAKANAKKQDKKPHLVVAKGAHRGVKGRPKGVKGKYKV